MEQRRPVGTGKGGQPSHQSGVCLRQRHERSATRLLLLPPLHTGGPAPAVHCSSGPAPWWRKDRCRSPISLILNRTCALTAARCLTYLPAGRTSCLINVFAWRFPVSSAVISTAV